MTGALWAVIVARVGNAPKLRLASALDAQQRRRLALAMLGDVLSACQHAPLLSGVVAVVDDVEARELARAAGAQAIDDSADSGMNDAVAAGLRSVRDRGADTAIVLPGDIPLLTPRDLEALVAAAGSHTRALIVGESRDGQGTNALLLRPTDVIAPAFGPPSVDRHLDLGRQANAHTETVKGLGLALDVDTPADLAALADRPVGPHTAGALADLLRLRPREKALIRF